jgi:F-type H+-transporting ATPase subunit a
MNNNNNNNENINNNNNNNNTDDSYDDSHDFYNNDFNRNNDDVSTPEYEEEMPPYSEEVNSDYQKELHIRTIGDCHHEDLNAYTPGPGDMCDFYGEFNRPHLVEEAQISSLALVCNDCFAIICHDCYQEYGEFTGAPIEESGKEMDKICKASNIEWNKDDNGEGSSSSPLDQFELRDIISINLLDNFHISLTNIGLYLIISFFILLSFHLLGNNFNKLMYNAWYVVKTLLYDTIYSIVINQINARKTGKAFFVFMYCLFTFILINNLIGMIPYSFASTSHFILTFSLSFSIVLGATILGFATHNIGFFSLLVPKGCPLGLLPLLVLIEFISYLARNISLGLRLAANILSGHMLLNILSGFTYNIMNSGILYLVLGLLPLSFIIAFSGLEFAIAFIQAQVFVVLSCSYIKDGLDLH